jgi:hypothetical protein
VVAPGPISTRRRSTRSRLPGLIPAPPPPVVSSTACRRSASTAPCGSRRKPWPRHDFGLQARPERCGGRQSHCQESTASAAPSPAPRPASRAGAPRRAGASAGAAGRRHERRWIARRHRQASVRRPHLAALVARRRTPWRRRTDRCGSRRALRSPARGWIARRSEGGAAHCVFPSNGRYVAPAERKDVLLRPLRRRCEAADRGSYEHSFLFERSGIKNVRYAGLSLSIQQRVELNEWN